MPFYTMLKNVFKNKTVLVFLLFLLIHLLLLNVNTAEWGDSYRILRASEYIRNLNYPADEKRPPLFSVLLALRPGSVDQILWGRIFMLSVSIASFGVFYKLTQLYLKEDKYKNLALLLFALNPVYLYWSIRIYADVPFTLLVMLAFYLLEKHKDSMNIRLAAVLGIIAGLSILTRFEGYILFGSLALGIYFAEKFRIVDILSKQDFLKRLPLLTGYIAGFFATVSPYWFYRNPLSSSYFDEPSSRAYDLKTLAIFVISMLFVFGVIWAWYFIFNDIHKIFSLAVGDIGIGVFVLIELILVLLWPAAVPRLFVPVIPFLIIFLAVSARTYFDQLQKTPLTPLLGLTTLIVIYPLSQYFLKLQFLVLYKPLLLLVLLIYLFSVHSILNRKYNLFVFSTFITLMIWSGATIWLHKDNFISIKNATEYASENLEGLIAYNDVSSVSNWYLNDRRANEKVRGVFYPYDKKADLEESRLKELGFDYLILTNEHNTDMTLDINQRPYLDEIRNFEYEVNGKVFFAKIVRVL